MKIETCSPDNPYTSERDLHGVRWQHVEAHEVPNSQKDGWPAGDTVRMRCDTCGIEWTKELPQ